MKDTQFSFYYALLLYLLITTQVFANQPMQYQGNRIAVVNVATLLENAPQSKIASEKLKADYANREKLLAKKGLKIQELSKKLAKSIANKQLSDEGKVQQEREIRSQERSYARELEDLKEEVRFAREQALDNIQKEIFSAIEEVRKQQHIDIIIQEYVTASKKIDITDAVLKYLQKKVSENTSNE